MFQYSKYKIKDTDRFKATDFPKVQEELDVISEATRTSSSDINAEVILSYLKDCALKSEWVDSNPDLAALLTSNQITTSHLEGLFQSCQQNQSFMKSFEEYIRKELSITT